MYNEKRKKKYLRYLAEDRGDQWLSAAAEDVFTKTERMEETIGTDLSELPVGYAESVFSSPSYSPFPSRYYQSLMIVLSYTGWCFSHEGAPVTQELLNIRPKDAATVRKRMVSGEEDLRRRLDLIFGDECADTFDTIVRAFAWMAFAGVRTRDMESIRKPDIDLSIPAAIVHERFHVLSHFAFYSVRFAAESETLVSLRTSERVKRADGDALSRNDFESVSGEVMERSFQNKASAPTGADRREPRQALTFGSILLSGLYCDIRREEMRRRPMNDIMKQFYNDYSEAVKGKRSDKIAPRHITITPPDEDFSALVEDYNRWKLAFLPAFQKI